MASPIRKVETCKRFFFVNSGGPNGVSSINYATSADGGFDLIRRRF